MKKLGLIGGIGPESTLLYYRKLVYAAHERIGEHFFPNLTIESLNVFEVFRFCQAKEYDGLTAYLMTGINNLIAAGAEIVALTGNTPHIVFGELRAQSCVPLISIVEATRQEALRRTVNRIGLLGTRFTMEADFFKEPLRDVGIDVIAPTAPEIDYIADKIASELERGIVKDETRTRFLAIVERMRGEHGIDALVLGCTELPLLLNGTPLPLQTLDTMEIHIDALLEASLR
ncbi:amino acid racemase [Sinorhizobium sp. BG8]|uniref:aspartate/glutamate racemase family protein n=1 Tax=Sinorhizobium sp. BG8 TaxID=2613773 RepID=UPI00193DD04E|nr:amino acid racemase [Sinorhizobium sp. BG8]QRM57247.1 amino acid racemase [Sinorhizobium sp. BG8]